MNFTFLYLQLLAVCACNAALQILRDRKAHRANELTDAQVHKLALISNTSHIDIILDNILIPRVVGTKNHRRVKNYIVKELNKLDWNVEVDEFEDVTPTFGKLRFANIVATFNPNAKRYLALACHYDSKYVRENDFVGATDSAVPCAMMLNLAAQMSKMFKASATADVSLKLIFFDGEEAFRQWGPTDSIYGARHLAERWDNSLSLTQDNEHVSELNRIDLLMLLDLLGTPDPKFYSYFSDTEKWYVRLAQAEERLGEMGQLRQYSRGHPQQTYFAQRSLRAHIEDDHIPFMIRDVPILHVIPTPFPDVWHTPADNRNAIDMHTVENLNKILRVFVAEYLNLTV
ncbi:iso Glutaminyl cyclase [Carabus blaptoides fortunei]